MHEIDDFNDYVVVDRIEYLPENDYTSTPSGLCSQLKARPDSN